MKNIIKRITKRIRATPVGEFYKVGDWISVNGIEGQVKNIRSSSTELQKSSGERIYLPNRMMVDNPIENYSIAGKRQIEIECGVDYSSDLEKVERLTKKAIVNVFPFVEKMDDITFFYQSFGDSSITFVARFWAETKSILEYNNIKSKAMIVLKKTFDSNEIGIPFPTRTLDIDWNKFPRSENKNADAIDQEVGKPRRSSTPPPSRTPFWNDSLSIHKA